MISTLQKANGLLSYQRMVDFIKSCPYKLIYILFQLFSIKKMSKLIDIFFPYILVHFRSNNPFITNSMNTTTTAYASLVIAINNTVKILSIIDAPVTVLVHLSILNFVNSNLMSPATTREINITQYSKRFRDAICVYANKFTE